MSAGCRAPCPDGWRALQQQLGCAVWIGASKEWHWRGRTEGHVRVLERCAVPEGRVGDELVVLGRDVEGLFRTAAPPFEAVKGSEATQGKAVKQHKERQ